MIPKKIAEKKVQQESLTTHTSSLFLLYIPSQTEPRIDLTWSTRRDPFEFNSLEGLDYMVSVVARRSTTSILIGQSFTYFSNALYSWYIKSGTDRMSTLDRNISCVL